MAMAMMMAMCKMACCIGQPRTFGIPSHHSRAEAFLERGNSSVAWGFAWNVRQPGDARHRFLGSSRDWQFKGFHCHLTCRRLRGCLGLGASKRSPHGRASSRDEDLCEWGCAYVVCPGKMWLHCVK